MAYLELENVTKDFGAFAALKGISLSVEEGEFVSILGGSGCGKTTTLRIVAGFEQATSGGVRLGGRDLSPIPPEKRELGFVFQHYALFPNMTVRRNISFGLKGTGLSRAETDKRVDDLLSLVRMEEFGHRYPRELSGGQQQRVALARALARRPKVLLLDEPLSALDAKIRVHLRGELRAIQRDLGVTTLYVTHDQEEALSLSDRVVLMKDGAIEQIGTPSELYNRPATEYAASFIGTVNSLDGRLVDPAGGEVSVGGISVKLGRPLSGPAGRPLRLLLRPESLVLAAGAAGDGFPVLPGRLIDLRFLGAVVRSVVELDGARGTVLVDSFNEAADPPRIGAEVSVGFDPERCAVY
jgi:putative spermidine/putrescine transport system ATP-binding protein